jgi:hypothetical protein
VRHYVWALTQAALARSIEASRDGASGATERHDAAVVGSLFESVAFLEAGINELFADAEDHREALAPVSPSVIARWAGVARKPLGLPRSVVAKHQFALVVADIEPFGGSDPAYENVGLVVSLRNRFVHYEPRWLPAGDDADLQLTQGSIEKRLLEAGVGRSPFSTEGDPFFPLGCVSYSCAIWSLRAAAAFSDAFRSRLGLPIVHPGEDA